MIYKYTSSLDRGYEFKAHQKLILTSDFTIITFINKRNNQMIKEKQSELIRLRKSIFVPV